MFVRELEHGQVVDQVLLVRDAERRSTRSGADFLRLVLADRTGSLGGVRWDCPEETFALVSVGIPIHVSGRYEVRERYGPQLKVGTLRAAAPGDYDLGELMDGSPHAPGEMGRALRELVDTIQEPHLRRLLDSLIGQ